MNDSNLYSEQIASAAREMQHCLYSSSVLTLHPLWLNNSHISLLSVLPALVLVSVSDHCMVR